jgi:phosphatidylserine/phosphatidylglycerophosphate/cardiolipin synthase-like enzyme
MADQPAEPEDFFLDGSEPDDAYDYDAAPPRPGIDVKPLIDGVAAFAAMEEAIAAATSSVLLSFWVFNPDTPVQSGSVRRGGAATWGDLLRRTAERGVTVRVLLTDFDPLLQKDLHRYAWRTHEKLVGHAARLGAGKRGGLEVLVSMHPAITRTGVGTRLTDALAALVKQANSAGVAATLANRPAVWNWLDFNKKTTKVAVKKPAPDLIAHVASHHQKLCIVDELLAFCGGLDVNTGRIDTPAHTSQKTAWHDVQLRVDAQAALDIHHNFVTRWNAECAAYLAFVASANKSGLPNRLPVHTASSTLAYSTAKPKGGGSSIVQIHRTLSKDATFGVVPNNEVEDIVRGYRTAIGQARHYIYIENQYVRSPLLRAWIAERARKVKDLNVIVVLPVAPEEVAGTIDPITNQGLLRQREILEGLAADLGTRFAAFSLVKRTKAPKPHATDSFGSAQIYVHSKVMLIDDVWATIGSANANPRSFHVDTELNAAFYDPVSVKKLRLALWNEFLGSPKGLGSWKPVDFVAEWRRIAEANRKAAPAKRSGFAVPHDPTRFPGAATPLLPDEFVDLIDVSAAQADSLLA